MKAVRQRHHTDESLNEFGDCLRAAVASVLELNLDDVPHFRWGAEDGDPVSIRKMWSDLHIWLRARGLNLLHYDVVAETLAEALAWCGKYNGGSYLLLGGMGPGGQGHVIVTHRGRVVHDPGRTAGSSKKPALSGPLPDGAFVVLAFEHRAEPRSLPPCQPVVIPPLPSLSLLDQHKRIGLSFSGGKDSLACAHLLRPHWKRLTFYTVDTGDLLPETVRVIDDMQRLVKAEGGTFKRIRTNSIGYQERYGLATDLLPFNCTPVGRAQLHGSAGPINLISRVDCCGANIWRPINEFLDEDGVTLVIRGTRREDPAWGWLESSNAGTGPDTFEADGRTVWLPIAKWRTPEVFAYLRSVRAPVANYYLDGFDSPSGPECSRCTAWCNESKAAYVKKHHPAVAAELLVRTLRVQSAIRQTLRQLEEELDALTAPATQ